MKSKQREPRKSQIVSQKTTDDLSPEAKSSVAGATNSPKGSFVFPKYEAKLIGLGIIIGVLIGIVLSQNRGKLCEISIGPLKFALPCSSASQPSPLTCADYGIKITSPQSGAKVWGTYNVTGTFVNDLPDDRVLLLLKAPAGDYFPQRTVIVDREQRTWRGEIALGDGFGKDFEIIVSIMGDNGKALFDYFTKVGKETGKSPAIVKLTDDMMECDRVSIVHER